LPRILENHKRLLSGESVESIAYRMIRKDGSVITLESTAVPVYKQDGTIEYLVGIGRDITERLEREKGLHRQLDHLNLLNHISMDITSVMSLEEVLERAVRGLTRVLKVDQCIVFLLEDDVASIGIDYQDLGDTSLEGMTFSTDFPRAKDLIAEAQPIQLYDVLDDMVTSEIKDIFQGIAQKRDMKSLLSIPIMVKGKMTGAFVLYTVREHCHFTDEEISLAQTVAAQMAGVVENARLLQREAHRAERLAILTSMGDALTSTQNLQDAVRGALEHICKLCRCDYESLSIIDVPGRNVTVMLLKGDGPRPMVKEKPLSLEMSGLMDIITNGEPVIRSDEEMDPERVEVIYEPGTRYRAEEGTPVKPIRSEVIIPMAASRGVIGTINLASTSPDFFDERKLRMVEDAVRYITISIDNLLLREERDGLIATLESRVRERTAELETARAKAEESDVLKSQLLSTVSHELKTPLHSIRGYAETLHESCDVMSRESRQEYLEIITGEARRLTELIGNLLDAARIETGMLSIVSVPMDLVWTARERVEVWRKRKIEQSISFVPPRCLLRVKADPSRVAQVIDNYIDNAVKYSPDDSEITVEVCRKNNKAMLKVMDRAAGIPTEHFERLFTRFYRVQQTNGKKRGGVGLGLSICQGLIDGMGGEVFVESQPGGGSTFGFKLPLIPDDEK
jgi:K+-sensing histidine kinase KdpD